jgi:hypothetical protein
VVAAMRVAFAAGSFFFDVGHFSCTCEVSISSYDAAAGQGFEAKESDNAHDVFLRIVQTRGYVSRQSKFSAVVALSLVLT